MIRHGRPIAGLASVLVMLVPSQDLFFAGAKQCKEMEKEMVNLSFF